MRIAITGGTGFVGRHLARQLLEHGHDVVLITRGHDQKDPRVRELAGADFHPVGLDDPSALTRAFTGCDGVAHLAGINRELGPQTYRRVHEDGTRHVTAAARQAGAKKILLLSFLRARPGCGSAYHESKWRAEEIVRNSGLNYTVLKAGVIYGQGDHMLNHLSHALHTFPVFALVGFADKPIRPTAVEDIALIARAALTNGVLSDKAVAVTGPEEMTLREAVERVAAGVRRQPWMFPLPVWFHYLLANFAERLMKVPLVSVAQVRILSEGLAEAAPPCESLPEDLAPATRFTIAQIRRGLPPAGGFSLSDLRCSGRCAARKPSGRHQAFFELP